MLFNTVLILSLSFAVRLMLSQFPVTATGITLSLRQLPYCRRQILASELLPTE